MESGSDKRRSVRRRCALQVEVRTEGAAFPIKCETVDASPYGCYITLMSTFPKDSVLDLVVWAGETALRMKGRVTTADANVGNGIEFLEITDEMRAQLAAYLEKTNAEPSDSGLIIR
jgi:PilZ domain